MHVSEHVSAEPDAGFSVREREKRTFDYGWEYEVATLISTDVLRPESVPNVVVGVVGHQPRAFGSAANELVTELLGSGRVIERVMGELSYFPHTRPDLVQEPLREHGTKLVMEYSAPS
ncbi:hypothetical protein [Microbacterium sp. p3-SID336]|uniref:hypothetical protein n=1 Tax=Microbacterium sp. p3-SID336 TaxID=2916212 RepID=UPI0021A362A2|nr:hypothetical protein [Microbacterium sp. p3-SID336]MCT1479377.1 hypothetical protein [Microbacterium sp. p3-SID336]